MLSDSQFAALDKAKAIYLQYLKNQNTPDATAKLTEAYNILNAEAGSLGAVDNAYSIVYKAVFAHLIDRMDRSGMFTISPELKTYMRSLQADILSWFHETKTIIETCDLFISETLILFAVDYALRNLDKPECQKHAYEAVTYAKALNHPNADKMLANFRIEDGNLMFRP